MHATVALWAMERGMAVHCQKPLTQTVWEARLLTKAAEKYKVATQMGNQGYSSDATRVACEIIWNGEIGDVTEVHSMSGGGFARGITEWPAAEEVPTTLDWDLWTGPRSGAHLQLEDPSVQLARVPGLRHADDRRLGHPHARAGQLGAAARQSHQRRVHGGGGSESGHLSSLRLQVRVPGASEQVRPGREDAAGDGLLV